jgi:hypothetical protein
MKQWRDKILSEVRRRLKRDPSGNSATAFLDKTDLTDREKDEYFREAEHRVYVEPYQQRAKKKRWQPVKNAKQK